ncbi:MAG: hypothetical protein WDW36_009426 [Sanguina aurantia]
MLSALRPLPPSNVTAWESLTLAVSAPATYLEKTLAGRPVAKGRTFTSASAAVADLALVRELVAADGDSNRVGYPASTVTLLGPNSLSMVADVERHRYLRRLISPGMASEEIDAALPRLALLAEKLLEGWAAEGHAGRTVSAVRGLKSFTFNIIMTIVFGEELQLPAARTAELEGHFTDLVANLFLPPQLTVDAWPFPFHDSMQARTKLLDFIKEQIILIRAQIAASDGSSRRTNAAGSRYGALRGILLARDEDGAGLTDDEAADNVVTLLFAGYDTTSSSLASAMHQIAMNPSVMAKLRAEQKEIVATYGPAFTPEVMRRMQYTEAVNRETLRFKPIIAAILRQSSKDFGLGGFLIPKDMIISVAIATILQNDPRWAEEEGALSPLLFNPDRFMTVEGGKAGEQVPFGVGSRNCLGMPLALAEMKIVLAVLARKFSYTADCDTDYKEFPIPEPRNGLPVLMTRYA